MTKKKSSKFVAVLMVSMLLLSVSILSVSAGNNKDTTFSFDFSGGIRTDYKTKFRVKKDATSSYMKCKKTNKTYTAKVWAGDALASHAYDVSRGNKYTFNSNTTWYMRNWANEQGYKYAGIFATPTSSGKGSATGVWSPDSI